MYQNVEKKIKNVLNIKGTVHYAFQNVYIFCTLEGDLDLLKFNKSCVLCRIQLLFQLYNVGYIFPRAIPSNHHKLEAG